MKAVNALKIIVILVLFASLEMEFPRTGVQPVSAVAAPEQEVTLLPADQTLSADPGQTIQFIETVQNQTGNTATFDLTLGDSLWPATLSSTTLGPLAEGEEATFQVNVTIPADARRGATNQVIVTATTSADQGTYSASALLTARAATRIAFLPLITTPVNGIFGKVTLNGAPAPGVFLELVVYTGSTGSVRASTTTDASGGYSFLNQPALAAGESYYIRFENVSDPSRLSFWATPDIPTFGATSLVTLGSFDIADIVLSTPEPGATVGLPTTFSWIPRPSTPTDSYELDLFDPTDGDPWIYSDPPLGYVSSYRLSGLPTGFSKGVTYGWSVSVRSPDGGYGEAYWYREFQFK